jgi:hypothetical protein
VMSCIIHGANARAEDLKKPRFFPPGPYLGLAWHRAPRSGAQRPCRQTFSLSAKLERVSGIEPPSSAWKAVALPLSYTRAASP